MDLSGQKVTVVGLGVSGLSAIRVLCQRGALVTVNDARTREQLGERAARAEALGAQLDLGGHDAARLSTQDLIVVSPGVPPLAQFDAAQRAGVPLISEVELAARFVQAPLIAVTGTNGKSTVTTLIGEMCKRSGKPTFVGGNLGTPLMDVVDDPAAGEGGFVVVELSSFQLERVSQFRAHVAVLLNVSADHLDRYPDFEAYAAAKARIFERQQPTDHAVLPAGDEYCAGLAASTAARRSAFGGQDGDVRVEGDLLVDGTSGLRFALAELGLPGALNQLNACAAALSARLCGVPLPAIEAALREVRGLPHRMQLVAEHAGVQFIDDSKATNVGAAVAAVSGAVAGGGRVVLIAGGKDKGGSYDPLVDAMKRHGRGLVLIGEATERIEKAHARSELTVMRAADMRQAVNRAHAMAQSGDAVLLAPACASFDMYRSYGHRGEVFQSAVQALTDGAKEDA